jgi:NAD(P)H-hydrate epimerase
MHDVDSETALYTTAQVRALDRAAIDVGTPGIVLMERAARAALDALRARWPRARSVCVLCGPGNNGGDGFLLAALAREAGLQVDVLALVDAAAGDAALARRRYTDAGGQLTPLTAGLPDVEVYVDGLFGSGLNRAPADAAARLIAALNAEPHAVLALDVPSGLDADTGAAFDPCVRATATVCFVGWKRGLFTATGPDHAGVCTLATLEVPAPVRAQVAHDGTQLVPQALPARARDSHKGRNGHVLVVGGELGTGGAVRLCGEAAARVGAGLVSVATREANVVPILAARPELMPHGVHVARNLAPLLARASVLALGPGLGQSEWRRELWATALEAGKPTVLDADGLNLLAAQPRALPPVCVLTPHPGEAARLLASDVSAVQADRFAAVRALAQKYRAIVVLKGAGSLIADPDGRLALCPWGDPGMGSGGMGDVLTGVIAGLMAQGVAAWEAACMGVGLHARAGDLAARAGERGLLASDLFAYLRALVNG